MSLLSKLPDIPTKTGWPWNTEAETSVYQIEVSWPRISIVIPSYNQGAYIEEMMRSVLLQNYPNLQVIVIDGGSTDNTVNVIKQYAPWINYWISEADKGQADAINKGLAIANGDVFNWLNSDDVLRPNALHAIGKAFKNNIDILAGVVNNFNDAGYTGRIDGYAGLQKNGNLSLSHYFNGGFYFHQPGVWYRRSLVSNITLNIQLQYCFDTEMLLQILEHQPKIAYTDDVLVNFRLHAQSKTTTQHSSFLADFDRINTKYTQHPDKAIAAMAKRHTRRINWTSFLNSLQTSPPSKLKRIGLLLKGIIASPMARLNRFSLGRLKQIITG